MPSAQQSLASAPGWFYPVLDNLPAINPADVSVSNPAASVVKPGFWFDPSGDIGRQGGSVSLSIGRWWSMGGISGGAPVIPNGTMYVRATLVSGTTPTVGTMSTWEVLSTRRTWANSTVITSVLDFEISADSGGAGAKGIGRFTITAT